MDEDPAIDRELFFLRSDTPWAFDFPAWLHDDVNRLLLCVRWSGQGGWDARVGGCRGGGGKGVGFPFLEPDLGPVGWAVLSPIGGASDVPAVVSVVVVALSFPFPGFLWC